MIKKMFITIMVFSLFGCKTITLKEANYNSEVENESEIKIKTYEIDKNKILLCVGNMEIKPYEAYYLDLKNKVFGSSSLTKFQFIKNAKKVIVNKSAIEKPPRIGIYKIEVKLLKNRIEVLVKNKEIPEFLDLEATIEEDYAQYMSVYQKKIILYKKN